MDNLPIASTRNSNKNAARSSAVSGFRCALPCLPGFRITVWNVAGDVGQDVNVRHQALQLRRAHSSVRE